MQTGIGNVSNQIQKWWSPRFTPALRQNNLLIGQLDRSYEGEIKKQGDSVYVSQITDVTGSLQTIGTDADSFDSELLDMSRITIQANKRATAAVEITDLALLQSQLDGQESAIRDSMMYAVAKQINTYLYSLIVPSTSSPDHALTSTDFNSATLATARLTAAAAKWPKDKPWFMNLAPSYYSDVLKDTTLSSSNFNGGETAMVGGEIGQKRYGFQIFEDNSLATDVGYAFTPDCCHLVVQKDAEWKLSDLHAQKKHAYLLSVSVIFGAKLGHDGDEKCIKWTAS